MKNLKKREKSWTEQRLRFIARGKKQEAMHQEILKGNPQYAQRQAQMDTIRAQRKAETKVKEFVERSFTNKIKESL